MKVRLHELRTTLSHTATMSERVNLITMRPYLVVFNSPAGTFTMTIKDSSGNTIASKSQTVSSIKSAASISNDYFFGFISFTLDNEVPLYKGRQYTFELSSSGYTFGSSYVGWAIEHELAHNNFEPNINIDLNPLALQLWGYVAPRTI